MIVLSTATTTPIPIDKHHHPVFQTLKTRLKGVLASLTIINDFLNNPSSISQLSKQLKDSLMLLVKSGKNIVDFLTAVQLPITFETAQRLILTWIDTEQLCLEHEQLLILNLGLHVAKQWVNEHCDNRNSADVLIAQINDILFSIGYISYDINLPIFAHLLSNVIPINLDGCNLLDQSDEEK